MRQSLRSRFTKSEGERARMLSFAMVGECSAGRGFLAVIHLDRTALFDGLSWSQIWIITAASIGGMVALFLSGDRLGQEGAKGALRGVAGGLWVTFVGALVGGTLALPVYGTMFGPFLVFVTLIGAPMLSLLWIVSLTGVHLLMGKYQRERDTIFAPAQGTVADYPAQRPVPFRRFS